MQVQISESFHIQLTPQYLLRATADRKDSPFSAQERKDYQAKARAAIKQGLEVMPWTDCDNYDEKTGKCQGHKKAAK